MASDEKKKSDDTGLLIAVGVALAALVAIPTALALLAWIPLSRWLARKECWALLITGLAAWILFPASFALGYVHWLKSLVTGHPLDGIPWAMLAATVAVFAGTYGLLLSTAVGARVPTRLQGRTPEGTSKAPTGTAVVPSREDIARMRPASATGILVDKDAHAIQGGHEPGKRRFPIGRGANGALITLGEDEVRTHGVILGATGSGKSETIKCLAGALLDLGWSGMILDLKEDTAPGGLRDWCEVYARVHSMPYQELRLSDPDPSFWFNPLTGIGPDEIRDMILTLQEFDDAYWQAINKELLGQLVNLVVWAHQVAPEAFPAPTMYDLGKVLSSGRLPDATKKMRAAVLTAAAQPGSTLVATENDFRALAQPSKDHATSAFGFGAKLTLIYDTQAGRAVLRAGTPGPDGNTPKRLIDVTSVGLCYVGLDSQGKADLTKVISSSVLQRMSVYAAQRTTGIVTGDRAPRFLIVDEANWVDRTIVQNLLSRARSAGIAMFLCTQGPEDWIDKNGDDWGRLSQNTNVAIIMRQGAPRSAELCADYLGKHDVVKTSSSLKTTKGVLGRSRVVRDSGFRVMENETRREQEEHRVPIETIRNMGVGEAVLKVGTTRRVEWVAVSMRDPAARVH